MRAICHRFIVAAILLWANAGLCSARADTPRLETYAVPNLADLQATVTVLNAEQSELEKISRDFGLAYRLKNVTMRYKEPGKLRMESRIGLFIVNGATRYFRVPQIGLTKKDEQGHAPGRRHSLLDVGLLTRENLKLFQEKYLREEVQDGIPVHVFEIRYRGDDTARYVLYIQSRKGTVVKREWFDSAGKLKATFTFHDLKETQPGLWIPTRIEIRNSEGVLAAVTSYTDLKINQGLEDSLFEIS